MRMLIPTPTQKTFNYMNSVAVGEAAVAQSKTLHTIATVAERLSLTQIASSKKDLE